MSYNPQNPNGQATGANSAPVVVASDQSAIPVTAASLPLPAGAATSAGQTNGTQKTQVVDGSGNVIGSTSNALNVNISGGTVTGSENITQIGGNNVVAAGVNGTLATGGNQAAGSNISSNTNPTLIGGSDYGGTAKLQTLKVDASGNAQVAITNTATVTANVGTTNGLALNASVTGLQVAQGSTTSGQSGSLAQGAVSTAAPTYTAAQTNPLSLDTSGNLRTSVNNTVAVSGTVTSTPSGTQNVNTAQVGGSAVATAASGVQKVGLADGSGNAITSTSSALDVNIKSGGNSSAATADEAAWTAGTSLFAPNGGVFNDSATALTSGQQGTFRATANRAVHTNLRNAAGTEIATASNPLQVSLANTASNATAVKVDGSGVTQPVSGSVGLATGTNSVGTVGLNAGSNNIGGVELIDAAGTNKLGINASGQAAVVPTGGDLTSGNLIAKVTDGTNTTNVGLGDASNGFVYTGAGRLTQAFNLTTTGAGSSYDVGNYRWVSVQVSTVGGSGASMSFQISNDNSNFVNTALVSSGSTAVTATTAATAAAGAGIYHGPLSGRYFRLNVTALASGSYIGTIIFSTQPGALASYGVAVSQQSSPWISTLQPSTSGGWSISSQTALTNTVVSAKASAGQVGGHMFYNPNSSVTYIQVFNVASGSVTLGTTAPTLVIPIPAAAAANVEWANGIAFGTAISFAATTTATGSTAPTTALTGFLLFK